jgi:hypothetical protein
MTLSDHIRLAFGRPHVARGVDMSDVTFDDGLEPPSPEQLEATHAEAFALWLAEQAAHNVPPPVTRRQLKRWLHSRGLLESVPQLIANIQDADARSLAQIDWEDASTFDADNPLVLAFASSLGMNRQQLHAAWREAAQIS